MMVSITFTHTMNTRATLVVSLVSGILTSAYFLRPIRVVRAQGPSSSLYWTEDYAIWDTGDPTDEQGFESDRIRLLRKAPDA